MRQHKIIFSYDRFIQLLFSLIASLIYHMRWWTWRFVILNSSNYTKVCRLNLSTIIYSSFSLFYLINWLRWIGICCANFILFSSLSFLVFSIFIFWKWQWPCPSLKWKIVELWWINSFDWYFLCVTVFTVNICFLIKDDCFVPTNCDCLFAIFCCNHWRNLSLYELILLCNNWWRWRNMSLLNYQFLFTFLSFFDIFHNA